MLQQRYKLIISYDGTDYCGWQSQKNRGAVADVMQYAFKKIFCRDVVVIGVSRTDSGVHAQGQVATIKTDLAVPAAQIRFAWNNALPASIHIQSLDPVAYEYNPFLDIDYKVYWYQLFIGRPSPFAQRYGWQVPSTFCVKRLQEALSCFIGTYDFRLFVTSDDRGDDTVRSIRSLHIESDQQLGGYKIVIVGPKFLRHMIRRVIGAAVAVASRADLSIDLLHDMLTDKRCMRTLVSAPARGLLLHKIVYHKKDLG